MRERERERERGRERERERLAQLVFTPYLQIYIRL